MTEAKPRNHLSDGFYTMPKTFNTIMTTKQVRETLLSTEGWTMACGRMWDIKSKRIGPGVLRVWLEERP